MGVPVCVSCTVQYSYLNDAEVHGESIANSTLHHQRREHVKYYEVGQFHGSTSANTVIK